MSWMPRNLSIHSIYHHLPRESSSRSCHERLGSGAQEHMVQMCRYLDDSISEVPSSTIENTSLYHKGSIISWLSSNVYPASRLTIPVQAPQYPVQSNTSLQVTVMHPWTILIQTHHSARVPLQMDCCEIFIISQLASPVVSPYWHRRCVGPRPPPAPPWCVACSFVRLVHHECCHSSGPAPRQCSDARRSAGTVPLSNPGPQPASSATRSKL